ncbi:hypothetical protein FGB62_27g18 [Gracilaria domingensis]|nr:hypothetical protein FGB62_27g18 [Gracilaria domingensis]
MHNRKSSIRLTTTRLQGVVGFGITSKKSARLTSLLGCAALILTVIGSFSIDGASRKATKFVTMPFFVAVTNSTSDFIDFTKHVSTDGSRVSATILLARMALSCSVWSETEYQNYPAVGDFDGLESIDSVVHPRELILSNFSCTAEEEKFVGVQPFSVDSPYIEDVDESCRLNTSLSRGQDSLWQGNFSLSCDGIEILEAWCASFQFLACSMRVRQGTRQLYMYTVPGVAGQTPQLRLLTWTAFQSFPSQFLKSAAYLMGTGWPDEQAFYLSRVDIKRNVPVEVEDGDVFETEVSVPLFLSTAGVVTVGTVMVCVVALISWRQHVVKRGLSGKNGFNGAMDILLLAAEMGADEEEIAAKGEVVVGVSRGEPRVGPMFESSVGSNKFDEHGVDGRLRRGTGALVMRVE